MTPIWRLAATVVALMLDTSVAAEASQRGLISPPAIADGL